MLEAKDLTKRYEDGLLALDHLNLRVADGELFCLLGANGAGKTTTINLFLDFIRPTEGAAEVDAVPVEREPLEAKRRLAYVSENVMLYGSFTARQNLEFFARLAGQEPGSREEYHMILRRVGLPEKAFEQQVKRFSKGMRQKVGIAIAIVKDAPNVLLDEPTSGLDPKSAAELMALLEELRDEGRAILMSTHDIFRAKEHADRIGIMKEGRLVMVRTRSQLEEEDLERLYLEYMEGEALV
ncbi:MAG: ABC transporter ATP-binding protein [Gemmatimonadota bacterium]